MATIAATLNLSEDQCWKFAAVVVHPLYRTMQCIHIILCAASIILLMYVFLFIFKQFIFHYNIKILFFSLYSACMLHSIWVSAFQIYHLTISYTFFHPCEVIIPPTTYVILHVPFAYSVIWIEFTMVMMFVERGIATLLFRCYENKGKTVGNLLMAAVLFLSILLTVATYLPKNFNAPEISALNTPSYNPKSMTMLFSAFTIINLLAVVCSVILHVVNSKKSIIGDPRLDLSAKYQVAENTSAARFLANITSGQLLIFTIYCAATVTLRISADPNDSTDPFYKSYIMVAYTVPWYTAALPIITIVSMQRMKNRRKKKIDDVVQIKSVGEEGWKNYSDQMREAWG